MNIASIGEIIRQNNSFAVKLKSQFKDGLTGLDGYSHLNILWWADKVDEPEYRKITVSDKPYKKGPEKMGIFSTRSPLRPNPISLTLIFVVSIDYEKGIVYTPYIDADPGTPVLDIKPYIPCADIVKKYSVPKWCSHWPVNVDESLEFNWEEEFNF
jgi:tRNA (adenine37-N6)-methyltransferase